MKRASAAFLVLAVCLVAGCEKAPLPTYPVKGTVQFEDGTPVRNGYIETLSHEHRINARGKIEHDGSFQLTTFHEADGAVAGTHDVVVVQFLGHEMAPQIDHDHGDAVATRFADYGKSGLTLEVGEQQDNRCVLVVTKARR
ncbi:hypothetical protein AB1K70_05915 [Bremerella sp. JC770]|uniref:hypothetical protein n=1 Tax=Bremerella sp. JC770 TaxID=3232137 RepID=UPI003458D230